MEAARGLLREKFGFADFLPGQEQVVESLLRQRDVLAVMPTGAGKSLCYQLTALISPGLAVVVSPLIALMRDQARKLRAHGLAAAALHSANPPGRNAEIEAALADRRLKLLYLSPERLTMPRMQALLRACDVSLLAIDEAHCAVHWGDDFRPEYGQIRAAAQALGAPQTLAVTATAGPRTRQDIVDRLFLRAPEIFVQSFARANIRLEARRKTGDSFRQMLDLVAARRGQSGIVYCASRRSAERMAVLLTAAGHNSLAYHAGLAPEQREAAQDLFSRREDVVLTATIAFGMGIDKSAVRFVFHLDPPSGLETLYQEIGRAGRDGAPAQSIVLFKPADFRRGLDDGARASANDKAAQARAETRRNIADYCLSHECREQILLAGLGEQSPRCGRCDNCRRGFFALRGALALPGRARRLAREAIERRLFAGVEPARPGVDLKPDGTETENDSAFALPDTPVPASPLNVAQARCLRDLKQIRRSLAVKAGAPPHRLVGDADLRRLAVAAPIDAEAALALCGGDRDFLRRYGAPLFERLLRES